MGKKRKGGKRKGAAQQRIEVGQLEERLFTIYKTFPENPVGK